MKLKNKIRYALLSVILALGVHLSIEPLYTPSAISAPRYLMHFPKYIARQAILSREFYGNTEEFIQGFLASYVDGIVVDIRLSKDKVPFLYHRKKLEEATNGHGRPEDFTWAQLEKLHYKNSSQSKLLKLDVFFKIVWTQKFIFLDIKNNEIFNYDLAQKIADLISKHHLQENVIVESLDPFFLIAMRLQSRDILLMYDFIENTPAVEKESQSQFDKILWLFKQPWIQKQIRRIVRPDILGVQPHIDKKNLRDLIDRGYPIISWTVNSPQIAKELFAMGIQGVQSHKVLDLLTNMPATNKPLYDAGGTIALPYKIYHVKSVNDIIEALKEARAKKKKVTIAGRKHSMGGQALLEDTIQLNMLGFNQVTYNSQTQTLTAGSGATWKKIQSILDSYDRSIMVMQSDNIFTVGGSISVNVHGWQVGAPPISSTIVSMTVITVDGQIRHITQESDPDLWSAIIGGYGLFGVIVDVELKTVPNSPVKFHAKFMKPEIFASRFKEHITDNSSAELAYGRLSVDQSKLFEEAGLFWYEKTTPLLKNSKLHPESFIALKRGILRGSQYSNFGKKLRWSAEKIYARKMSRSAPLSRNNAMNTDIHILWPFYGKNKDILHEYFLPKRSLYDFIKCLRKNIIKYKMNILNVTIREVRRDNLSLLTYAKQDVFGLVCLFSQQQTLAEEEKMRHFTQAVIEDVLNLEGTFYLPYRLHYTKHQLLQAYPSIVDFLNLKEKRDSDGIFDSYFFQHIKTTLEKIGE